MFASVLLVCLIAVTVDAGAPQAVQPVERTDENSRIAHRELVEKARTGQTDLYFAGDSILRRWGALDYPELLEHFQERFHGWNAADFAWGGGEQYRVTTKLMDGYAQVAEKAGVRKWIGAC